MEIKWAADLQLFADGAAAGAASAAGAAPAAETPDGGGEDRKAADIKPGDVLESGTRVDARLAASMKKHPEKYRARQAQAAQPRQTEQPQQETTGEKTAEDLQAEWDALRKGKFKDLYGKDVQSAIQERFRNQTDAGKQLKDMQPMLDVLMKTNGAKDIKELQDKILNDDRVWEDEAEKAGMTVEAFKTFQKLKAENEENKAREQQRAKQAFVQEHLKKLATQGEALKERFPDFDLQKELANPAFARMTGPNVGISVEDAYYAVHHKELMPQIMAYGVRKAQNQISQSMAANARRPMEGAAGGAAGGQGIDVGLNPANLTQKEREDIKRRVRMGEKITFR